MSIQPVTPWDSGNPLPDVRTAVSPPTVGSAVNLVTPSTSVEPKWVNAYRSWSNGNMAPGNPVSLTPLSVLNKNGPRRALGEMQINQPAQGPTFALASPFMPGDPNTLWGPPNMAAQRTIAEDASVGLELRLAEAEEKIRQLSFENTKLKENAFLRDNAVAAADAYLPPSSMNRPTYSFDNFNAYGPISSGPQGLGALFEDEETASSLVRNNGGDDSSDRDDYVPSQYMVIGILHGTFSFVELSVEYIRPIVWIIAHCQPRTSGESAGLKAAVNALAARFSLPRESDSVNILINSIIGWAKNLCFTSCGNYLCQQLLDRGEVEDKKRFISEIELDLIAIASDKFGTHVLCKAVGVKELEEPIAKALLAAGIFESMKTGARRLWREYLDKCRQTKYYEIFQTINEDMAGKWADLACINEHGSIAVQQIFEVFDPDQAEPCFRELLSAISRIANNQFGHFVTTKLIGNPARYRQTCDAIITAYPPVAITHHGVNFAKIALTEGGRASVIKYVDAICSHEDGRTPGIVAIATSSIGKAHLTFVLSCLTPSEHVRVRHVCRTYSTTLRNSQSGNDLLRSLGVIHATGPRHRAGP